MKSSSKLWLYTSASSSLLTLGVLVLREATPHSASVHSEHVFSLNHIVIVVALLCVQIILTRIWIKQLIVKPLTNLSDQSRIALSRTTSEHILNSPPGDEFASLTSDINQIVNAYRRSQRTAAYATKNAQIASDAKSAFIAGFSAELRVPLNTIIGVIEILDRMALPIQLRQFLPTVRESASILLELVNDVVLLGDIESGKLEFQPSEFGLHEIISSVATGAAVVAFQKNVELLVNIQPSTPHRIIGDGLRLKRILTCLLDHAIQQSNVGEVILSIGSGPGKIDGQVEMLVSVQDSSIGIRSDLLDSVFEGFAATTTQGGSEYSKSLSLPIARSLAYGIGASLWIESDYGHGSTLFLRWEASVGSNSTAEVTLPYPQDSEMLVVDSNSLSSAVLKRLLGELGYQRVVECSPAQLLERLNTQTATRRVAFIDGSLTDEQLIPRITELSRQGALDWYAILPPTLSSDAMVFLTNGAIAIIPKPLTRMGLEKHLCSGNSGPSQLCPSSLSEPLPATKSSNKLNILVVDDVASNRLVLSELLLQWGHTVTQVGSGLASIRALRDAGHFDSEPSTKRFDLVFMDVQMPEMAGTEATRLIRTSEQLVNCPKNGVPIIAVTANIQAEDLEACIHAGMFGAITKPIEASKIYNLIETLCSGADTWRAGSISEIAQEATASSAPELIKMLERPDLEISIFQLWDNMGHDLDVTHTIIDTFLEETPKLLSKIEQSTADSNLVELRAAAHSMRGSLGNCGAYGAMQLARLTELAAKQGDGAEASRLAADLLIRTREVHHYISECRLRE